MESLELRIFREVAYTGSITKTAEQMGYVQSNVTAHIKKLEYELHTILFDRHPKGVTLTMDGEKLLQYTEQILQLMDTCIHSFLEATETLKIGTTQTIAGYRLPTCIVEYRKQFPAIKISICSDDRQNLEDMLRRKQIDCIITNQSHGISFATSLFEMQEELVIIAPANCHALSDLKDYAVITNQIKACPYREALLRWWDQHQSNPPHIIEQDSVEAIINTVACGGGISLLPRVIIQKDERIHTFPLEDSLLNTIHMWVLPEHAISPKIKCLQEILEKQMKNSEFRANKNKHA